MPSCENADICCIQGYRGLLEQIDCKRVTLDVNINLNKRPGKDQQHVADDLRQ